MLNFLVDLWHYAFLPYQIKAVDVCLETIGVNV